MFNMPDLHQTALTLPAILAGLTFHEFAHGWAAKLYGDNTARNLGRLSLNPLVHIDILGFILLIFYGFGWAKPVPVNPVNFRGDMRRGMLMVSLAGPAANIIIAVASAVILGVFAGAGIPYFKYVMGYMIRINVMLGFFNLIPVPPLDGSKILVGLIPGRQNWLYQLEAYGAILLVILIFTGAVGFVFKVFINPFASLLFELAAGIAGLFM
ncbi:MAG TPA: site-2 protease family protein [Bacillota bacterium]|nr:site-2 protease family protein [Bacillota bacterium]